MGLKRDVGLPPHLFHSNLRQVTLVICLFIYITVATSVKVDKPSKEKTAIENLSPRSRENIEEIVPDEWDLKMLKDIETDPDCHEFIPREELLKELGISL